MHLCWFDPSRCDFDNLRAHGFHELVCNILPSNSLLTAEAFALRDIADTDRAEM